MKIVDIKTYVYSVPAVTPAFRWRDGLPGSEPEHDEALVRVITDEGIEGYAVCHRGFIVADLMKRRLKEAFIGEDPLRREWLWHKVWELDRIEEFPIYVLGLLDIALWDIAGKIAKMPVYKLLGGFREEIPAYASTVTYGSVEEFLDVADQCLQLGYGAIKLHAWGDARKDAHLCQALRKHVGDDIPLMYDGSAGFDLPDAIYVGRALEDAGYTWYEEPMREFSVTSYRRLSELTRVPLLVAETSDGAHFNTADFIAQVNCHYVRTGVDFRGGFSGAIRTAHLAEAYGLRAEVHGGGSANIHLCMSIPNTTYFESLVWGNPVRHDANVVDGRGCVKAPKPPGIGIEVDLDDLESRSTLVF